VNAVRDALRALRVQERFSGLRRAAAASPFRAIAMAAVIAGAALLVLPLPVLLTAALGLPLVLVAPGWLVSATIFRDRALDPVLHGLLAIGLSIAIAILTGLLLAALGLRLGEASFTAMAAGETAVAALAAERSGAQLRVPRLAWTATARLVTAAVAVSAVALATARITPTAKPQTIKPYTALWAERQPRQTVRVGVMSGELSPTRYRLDVMAGKVRLTRLRLDLRPGQQWQVKLRGAGIHQRMRIELRRGAEARLYREVDVPK
jgi:hypothetical protein